VRLSAAAVCLFLCALALAASTTASSSKTYTVKVNDVFLVAGTDLGCETIIGKKLLVGKKLVACYKLKNSSPALKSYAAALAADGEVAVARANPDGTGTIVFRRKPSALAVGSKTITVNVGDQVLFSGTDLACAITKSAPTGVYTTCFRLGKSGGRPNSYGFAQTSKFTAIVKFDGVGLKSKVVYSKKHG
jgi:hypothetical protein